jgi:DNA-binding MarR family transcriptional regulator
LLAVTLDRAIAAVQFAYPQIYYACHTRHARGRSSDRHLSPRDSQMLVHLDSARPLPVSLLARHMGLAVSTVSEATKKLERFGYVARSVAEGGDRRRVGLALTDKGRAAVQHASVLETGRLRTVLRRLSTRDLYQVVGGLTRLARACGPSMEEKRGWHDA